MGATDPPFNVSRGWAEAFFKRHGFKHRKVKAEQLSVDTLSAKDFPAILKGFMADGTYTRDQIFNADETALY